MLLYSLQIIIQQFFGPKYKPKKFIFKNDLWRGDKTLIKNIPCSCKGIFKHYFKTSYLTLGRGHKKYREYIENIQSKKKTILNIIDTST